MIRIAPGAHLDESELIETFVRASGPGGQNVNKLATAVELRFDVFNAPGLDQDIKERLAKLAGRRLTLEGVIVIFAQKHRTQEMNRASLRVDQAGGQTADPPASDQADTGFEEKAGGVQDQARRHQGPARAPLVRRLNGH